MARGVSHLTLATSWCGHLEHHLLLGFPRLLVTRRVTASNFQRRGRGPGQRAPLKAFPRTPEGTHVGWTSGRPWKAAGPMPLLSSCRMPLGCQWGARRSPGQWCAGAFNPRSQSLWNPSLSTEHSYFQRNRRIIMDKHEFPDLLFKTNNHKIEYISILNQCPKLFALQHYM